MPTELICLQELYKLWQQQKLPNFIVSLAADTKQDGTEGQPAGMLSGLPLLPLQDSAPPGPVSSLPGVTNPLLSQTLDVSRAAGPQAVPISTKEVSRVYGTASKNLVSSPLPQIRRKNFSPVPHVQACRRDA